MAKVFITGSADGLGFLAGKMLLEMGHKVVLHARNPERAAETREKIPGCDAVVTGDVSSFREMRDVAEKANALGRFDAVIHNVGLGDRLPRVETSDGVTQVFAVNVVAPYVLTALMGRPHRLVYLSSGMQSGGDASLEDPQWKRRRWNASQAYSDTKLHDLIMAKALARLWPTARVNTVDPGWVPTRMGGPHAPDDLRKGVLTQVWLATSDEPAAKVSGRYFHHQQEVPMNPLAESEEIQDRLLAYLQGLTGLSLRGTAPNNH